MSDDTRMVTLLQYDPPPLQPGEYTIQVEHRVNQEGALKAFTSTRKFAVTGERFAFDPADLHGCFPPHQTSGEFEGVLPQFAFARRTLPWERSGDPDDPHAPWLAVLLITAVELEQYGIKPTPGKARDLIPCGEKITVIGSDATDTGTLPDHYCSYPHLNPLDYGQAPDTDCTLLDLPVELFDRIAPCREDLPYLAHIREVATANSVDHTTSLLQLAVVMSNRAARPDATSYAFLVSLERFAPYLPDKEGGCRLPGGTEVVRLLTHYAWNFTAGTLQQSFKKLAENLNHNPGNTTPEGKPKRTTLQLPFGGDPPTAAQIATARSHQSSGQLTAEDTRVLLGNAFAQGYAPLPHDLRHGGKTVSWYRGPLAPWGLCGAQPQRMDLPLPLSCPDAANRFDPETGMFDVSYGAAWQLGQLLALQNTGYATALYVWQQRTRQSAALAEEQKLITEALAGGKVFPDLLAHRQRMLTAKASAPNAPPDTVVQWIARLRLLHGVPLSYLVPDERMLPVESMRFFYLDFNWLEALVDGAFSIGRVVAQTEKQRAQNAALLRNVTLQSHIASRLIRRNGRVAALSEYQNPTGEITGFLLRSQLVSGWARLGAQGYLDRDGQQEIPSLRMSRLGPDLLLCLFDGPVQLVTLHEPPEQLHCGVEGAPGAYTTPVLRSLKPPTTGKQFTANPQGGACDTGSCSAPLLTRSDGQTLQVAESIKKHVLPLLQQYHPETASEPTHGLKASEFTSAEWGLEMTKGAVMVAFPLENGGHSA